MSTILEENSAADQPADILETKIFPFSREEENSDRRFALVTRAEPSDAGEKTPFLEISPRALLVKGVHGLDRLDLILDSGANEFMIKDKSLAKFLGKKEAKITTASEGNPITGGLYGEPKNFLFSDGRTDVGFGRKNTAVFAEPDRQPSVCRSHLRKRLCYYFWSERI